MSQNSRNRRAQRSTDQCDEELQIDDAGSGLTDDQRVSREKSNRQTGARVTPGPADQERQMKR